MHLTLQKLKILSLLSLYLQGNKTNKRVDLKTPAGTNCTQLTKAHNSADVESGDEERIGPTNLKWGSAAATTGTQGGIWGEFQTKKVLQTKLQAAPNMESGTEPRDWGFPTKWEIMAQTTSSSQHGTSDFKNKWETGRKQIRSGDSKSRLDRSSGIKRNSQGSNREERLNSKKDW